MFVKNLENLQGDERDVIFISYTYGPDQPSGRVMQRFGPITHEFGWRRLNVLITRARERVEVFSSMAPRDILPEGKKLGVAAMRDYLQYARDGVLPSRSVDSGRPPDSAFEEAVAKLVESLGYRVKPQVGVAGYFIDVGVLAPDREDEYILGIECDGATYHSAKSARDRDRIRQDVISSRGWTIHRVWSTDWYRNLDTEVSRLEDALENALARYRGRDTTRGSTRVTFGRA
jgi:very-short-patch-repair endonuclease